MWGWTFITAKYLNDLYTKTVSSATCSVGWADGAVAPHCEWNNSKAQKLTAPNRWKSPLPSPRSPLFFVLLCHFVLLICLFSVSIRSAPQRPRHNMWRRQRMRGTDGMGRDPPGVLQGARSSGMPGMAQGSQRHEPPTLNKRLAVVPGLDPPSRLKIRQTGESLINYTRPFYKNIFDRSVW